MNMITALYAGLHALLLLCLSLWVVMGRFKYRVSVGDGGEKRLLKRMRVQANFIEHVPLALILMLLLELQGTNDATLHILGSTLLIARFAHAIGFGRTPQIVIIRRLGVILTVLVLLSAALITIWSALTGTV